TDDQWEALRDAIGRPEWATDPALSEAAGRRARHDLVDERLAAWCLPQSSEGIVEILWTAGVPVAKVMQPHRQAELPQLRHRRFFEQVGHPVNVAAPHSTLPVNLSNGPDHFHRQPAPLLGQHNHELLSELGLADDEILALEEDGVIGTAPATGGRRKASR
ncbi:MAG: CoA transferase, partial [Mycobacterium sp.]